MNKDKTVTIDELEELIELKYKVERSVTRQFFKKVDVDNSGDLAPGELVDFRYFHLQKLSYHFFQHDFSHFHFFALGFYSGAFYLDMKFDDMLRNVICTDHTIQASLMITMEHTLEVLKK